MTEAEWLGCADLDRMLDFLRGEVSERKLRLFACACIRQGWEVLEGASGRVAVEIAEAYVDGAQTKADLKRARQAVAAHKDAMHRRCGGVWDDPLRHTEYCLCEAAKRAASEQNLWNAIRQARFTLYYSHLRGREAKLPAVLRDIIGNPFRPVAINPVWLTPNVVDLARTIYEDRAFDRLPILADALMDAGCEDEAILAHCRSVGPHVRGCWVVDLLLGKE